MSRMLRLPPAGRCAVAIRIVSSAAQPSVRLPPILWAPSILAATNGSHLQPPGLQRSYATLHHDPTKEMWQGHGDAVFNSSVAKVEKQVPKLDSCEQKELNAFLKTHLSSVELPEAQELLKALVEAANTTDKPDKRTKFRRRIREALDTKDVLPSLRDLADIYSISTDPNSTDETQEIQLMDLAYVARTMPLPSQDQYPDAVPELFEPASVSMAVHNQCQKRHTSMHIEVDVSPKEGLSKALLARISLDRATIQVCTLSVQIADLCRVTAFGEGLTKESAKQAAWMHLVSRMHVDGTLKDLFASKETQPGAPRLQQDEAEAEEFEGEGDFQPVEVDDVVKQEENDAKKEIYDYAASLGLIPTFETKMLQSSSMHTRPRHKQKSINSAWQVRVQLEGRNINVSAIGKDLRTAEVAAALAFKAEAEKQHIDSKTSSGSENSRILTVDNAKEFFRFYKARAVRTNVALEHEMKQENGVNMNCARILLNGSHVGQEVFMKKKSEAESVAYLTAAVELTNAEPILLGEFQAIMTRDNGKVLRSVRSITLPLSAEAAMTMRHGLLEARKSGLSDIRRTLGAETSDSTQRTYQLRSRLSEDQQRRHSERLLTGQQSLRREQTFEELRSKRAALPMSQYKNRVLSIVSKNPYCIVVGATGSGKTTQVPQILFEGAIEAGFGASCNIICTQPRRIAATSVARRVAAERNETLGNTVGYQVRFDSKPPRKPYGITYCTTGVLLERLKHDPEEVFDTTSHICIDEVHERDIQIDFLMIVLKKTIEKRQSQAKSIPKIILMSATLDTELFASYFGQTDGNGKSVPCPALTVPGRTFLVQQRYLRSIMEEMQEQHGSELTNVLSLHSETEEYLTAENAFSAIEQGKQPNSRKKTVIDWKREWQESIESDGANEKKESFVPVSLVAATVAHLCKTTEDGAILVFLPGLGEILEVQKLLTASNPLGINFNDDSHYLIFPLHSTSTPEQQAQIFNTVPSGCRKIVLATNIAETSVTVTDVKYVVDSGKLREKRYDQLRRITKLQCVWVSKSNAKQRAGRAGRVQDGYYYALYSQERSQALKAIGRPELLRSDLQETCLAIKAQHFSEPVGSFLAEAIEPPTPQAVSSAVRHLVDIEAITSDESLTALGRVLSKLPVHPFLGKTIILGVIFRCLDPLIILSAASSERPLFVSPVGMREEALQSHNNYAPDEQSDQLALIAAFQELRMIRAQYGYDVARRRATEHFLHWGAFNSIDQTTRQIEEVLIECGLIPPAEMGVQPDMPACGHATINRNSQNSDLVKSLIIAGLSSNMGVKTSQTGVTYRTPKEDRVNMHPRSQNADTKARHVKHPPGSLFTYGTLAKGSGSGTLFMRETTKVTPLQTVLFGGQLRLDVDGKIEMDEWLPFHIRHSDPGFGARLVLEFRKALDRVLFRAFESLEDLTLEKGGRFADDPVRENFVKRVVQVLSVKETAPVEALKEWNDVLLNHGH